jgi:hypothetical protein
MFFQIKNALKSNYNYTFKYYFLTMSYLKFYRMLGFVVRLFL